MIVNKNIAKKTAQLLLKIDAVSFRFNPPFTYTTGMKSPIYLDNRIVMSYPAVRRKIVEFYVQIIKEKIGLSNIDYISGTASAAIPQASWVAGILDLPMVYIRPSTKSYGKGNKLEGYLKKSAKLVIIEDHVSTATSIVNNAETVRELGGKVSYAVATTTYDTKESDDLLKNNKITLFALTDGKTIVEQSYKNKVLNDKQKKSVDLWFKDPSSWASLALSS
ncbi:MAG: orotate phosphoribosyltransferase [Patescibacteria group bacterium]